MTPDDDFPATLRALAGSGPRIHVDRERVVRAGRRRRALRAGASTGAALLTVGAVVAGASALSSGGRATVLPAATDAPVPTIAPPTAQAAPSPAPLPDGAVVDTDAGTVTLPLDHLLMTAHDEAVLRTAQDLSTAACMAEAGYDGSRSYAGPAQPQPSSQDWIFGVWRPAQVSEGYSSMMAPDEPPAGPRRSDDELSVLRDCLHGAVAAGFVVDLGGLSDSGPAGFDNPAYLPEGVAVLEEWRACLDDHGVTPPEEMASMLPAGMADAPLAEQVRVAGIDVACKQEHDTVRRLADIAADSQLAYAARGGLEYLEAAHAVQQRAVDTAQAYLDGQGVVVPE